MHSSVRNDRDTSLPGFYFMYLLEYWKDIPGLYPYQASFSGKIRHMGIIKRDGFFVFNWVPATILKPTFDRDKYLRVMLYIHGKRSNRRVHVLVGLAFIPNPNNYSEINHINSVRFDNQVVNLEWCTRKQNAQHAGRVRRLKNRLLRIS